MKNVLKVSLFALALGVFASCGEAQDAANAAGDAAGNAVEAGKDAAGTAVEAGKEAATTVVAAGDSLAKAATATGEKAVETVKEAVAPAGDSAAKK
jgi:ABC-type Fe3+-hydroxamate transport system substrate-binding protein